jgi:hypothetical protein
MAAIKTQKNDASVTAFLDTATQGQKRKDCDMILKMMQQASSQEPKMWGSSIIGFGSWHYKSEKSRQEGDWFITGFSPRKQNITLYILPSVNSYKDILAKLGKYKTSVSCLYINKLADVDVKVLKELINTAYKNMKDKPALK